MKDLYNDVLENCKKAVCEILGEEDVDCDENFFYLGIESIAMTKIVGDLEDIYNVNIAYEDFIEHASINEFAEFLTDLIEKGDNNNYLFNMDYKVDPSKWGEPFELSELQEAYFVGRIQEEEYNGIPTNGYMEMLCEEYDHEKFMRIIVRLINRHPMLRCYFDEEGMQHILDEVDYYDVDLIDLSNMDEEAIEKEVMAQRRNMVNLRVDISMAPLLITRVSKLSERKAIIHFYVDALILDGWSYEAFHRELEELYNDETICLPELGVTYRDYVDFKKEFRKTEKYKQDKEFWMNRIEDLPEAAVLPEINDIDTISDKIGVQVECELDIETWRKIEKAAQQHNVTPFSVLFTSFILVVSRWNYKQRLLFNIPEFDRPMFHEDMDKILGVCSNFLLFTADNSKKITFAELVKKTQEELTVLIQHHGFSGIEVSREIYKRSGEHNKAVAPLVFGLLPELPHKNKELLKVRYQENHTSQVWIDINTCIYDDCIQFNWNFIENHLDERMLSDMVQIQKEILNRVATEEDIWSEKISFDLPEYDRNIIEHSNDTMEEISFVSFPKIIESISNEYAKKEYVITDSGVYTYEDVINIVRSFASDLKEMGCKKGDRVVVFMPKGIRQVCAVLAITYIGAVYVPMDYNYPLQMLKKCAENVGASVIVTSHEKSTLFENEVIYIPDLNSVALNKDITPEETSKEDLIAIIHTSGSTGVPKAVMVTQQGLYNSLIFTNKKFDITKQDRCIALTNLAHDMSMYDIFGMLMAGASVFMPCQEKSIDPEYWIEKMKEHKITLWNSVPAFASMLLDSVTDNDKEAFEYMRTMIFGGDYLKNEMVKRIWSYNDKIRVINVGGPTETTLWNIYHEVTKEDLAKGVIPYGKPISNTKYYLLNEKLETVPIGVVGMMYCAGVGVTKGYWNDVENTDANYFIYEKTGERIYKTGDLGKYNENGEIIFCGREDKQIKINGKRIELEGISTIMRCMDEIKDCVIQFFDTSKTLVAYYVSETDVSDQTFYEYLVNYLPKYMLPNQFIRIDAIPLTKNGKVDYKKLSLNKVDSVDGNGSIREVKTEIERTVVTICGELLNKEVTLESDFFMIGGDSLLAVRLLSKFRETFDISISLTELYGKTKIVEWCDLITNKCEFKTVVQKEDIQPINNISKWIGHGNTQLKDGKIKLLCIPHAGSSAMFYSNWEQHFGEEIQILPLQYPGRENRQHEAMYDSITDMARDFVEQCPEIFEGEFAIFGHCTGSIVGYEILRYVKEHYNKTPLLFIASSNSAPIHPVIEKTKGISDEQFIRGLSEYGFIDKELFELDDFSSYYLPIIRHDFIMQENYICKSVEKIDAPLYVFSGKDDLSIKDYNKVLDWKDFTTKEFDNTIYEGGHFYMESNLKCICETINGLILSKKK